MKRKISFLLCLVMVLSLVAVPARADDGTSATTVDAVELTITLPEHYSGEVSVTVPEGKGYSASAQWGYAFEEESQLYLCDLTVTVTPDEGYSFSNEVTLTVNGEAAGYVYENGNLTYTNSYSYYPIEHVDAVYVYAPVVGEKPHAEIKDTTGMYKLGDAVWSVKVGDEYQSFDGIFESDHTYKVSVVATPIPDTWCYYFFTENTTASVWGIEANGELQDDGTFLVWKEYTLEAENIYYPEVTYTEPKIGAVSVVDVKPGEYAENFTVSSAVWTEKGSTEPFTGTYQADKCYTLTITLTPDTGYKFYSEDLGVCTNSGYYGVTGEMDGKNLVVAVDYELEAETIYYPEVTYTEPEVGAVSVVDVEPGAYSENFTVSSAVWTEKGSTEPFTGTYQAGKCYTLTITLTPDAGYKFYSEDLEVYTNVGYVTGKMDGNNLVVAVDYDFRPLMDSVMLTNIPTLNVGDPLPVPSVQAPDGVKITDYYWTDAEGNILEVGTTAKDLNVYTLNLVVECTDENYTFVSGWNCTYFIADNSLLPSEYTSSTEAVVMVEYSFLEVIPEIIITGMPESLKAGDATTVPAITVPEGAPYNVHFYGWYDCTDGQFVHVDEGTFEEGKLYCCEVVFEVTEPTKQLGDTTKITTDGNMYVSSFSKNYGYSRFYYAVGLTEIDRVDLTVTGFGIGEDATKATVTVAADAGYIIYEYAWLHNGVGYFTGTFEEGVKYNVYSVLTPKDGYYFANEVDVYINGVAAEDNDFLAYSYATDVMAVYYFDPMCSHSYTNACDAACDKCGAARTPADHVYDNACDAACNICGAARTPADHVYDNACDAACDKCGAARTPADHVYDDQFDASCNACGATREVALIQVEGNVANISSAAVDKAVEAAKDSGNVIIESGAMSAQLPVAALTNVANAECSLTITTTEAAVTLDATTLAAVAAQAGGETVTIEVKQIAATALNTAQQAALEGQDVAMAISAEMICNGTLISDFKGGSVTVVIPFTPEEGSEGSDYTILYVADDGSISEVATTYSNGCLVFTLNHFSEYVVVNTGNDETEPEKTVPSDIPATGDNSHMAEAVVALLISCTMLVVLIPMNKKRSF